MDTVRAVIDALRRAPDVVLPLVREVPQSILTDWEPTVIDSRS